MSGHMPPPGIYQQASSGPQHYSHPYVPYGEPRQPLRTNHSSNDAGRYGVDAGIGSQYRSNGPSRTSSYGSTRSSTLSVGDDSGPVPAPVVRAEYAAPVFQTFQERKRAKEAALRAQLGDAGGTSTRERRHNAFVPPPGSMMGPPPLPHTTYSSSSHGRPPLSSPGVQVGPNNMPPPPPPVNISSRPKTPEPARQTQTPVAPIQVRPASSRPLPSPISTSIPGPAEAGPSTPRTPRSAASAVAPVSPSILDRSDTVSSVKSLDRAQGFGSPSKRPLPKPPVAVNTSKSLDRGIPSGIGGLSTLVGPAEGYKKGTGRKLPSTVTELSEGSEDGLVMDMTRMSMNRSPSPTKRSASPVKSPSAPVTPAIFVSDQSSRTDFAEVSGSLAKPAMRHGSPSPIPRIVTPPVIIEPPSGDDTSRTVHPPMPIVIEPPVITVGTSPSRPATFTPLPAINIGSDSDDEDVVTPGSGIVYGGLPMIAVSSSDAFDDEHDQSPVHQSAPSTTKGGCAPSMPHSHHDQGPTRLDPTAAIICAGCANPIIGRIVSAMDQRWHPQCFTCGECGELLEHVSSYEYNGKPYCHLDYHDNFAHRCHHCKTPIVEPRFITLDDPVLGQRFYHELHFFCSECGDPFLDPSKSSAPGTERSRLDQPEEEETNAFVIQKGHPYCERCHLRLHKPKCKGCTRPIPDVAVDAMGGKWHQECFVCAECGNGFANSLFFPKNGKAFCTECYEVMIGN